MNYLLVRNEMRWKKSKMDITLSWTKQESVHSDIEAFTYLQFEMQAKSSSRITKHTYLARLIWVVKETGGLVDG